MTPYSLSGRTKLMWQCCVLVVGLTSILQQMAFWDVFPLECWCDLPWISCTNFVMYDRRWHHDLKLFAGNVRHKKRFNLNSSNAAKLLKFQYSYCSFGCVKKCLKNIRIRYLHMKCRIFCVVLKDIMKNRNSIFFILHNLVIYNLY